jgi:signal transduction histidine kinase
MAHVTELFFTTRQNVGGSGLGLWICQRILEQHGGRLTLRSDRNGTTVVASLPRGENR